MADSTREIRAKYVADLGQLESATKRATDIIVSNVQKANQAQQTFATKTTAVVEKSVQTQTKVIGKFATSFSAIGGVLGQAGGQVAQFTGRLGQAVFATTEAFFAGGGFLAALSAAGIGIALLKPHVEALGRAFEDFSAKAGKGLLALLAPQIGKDLDELLARLDRIADGTDEALGAKGAEVVKTYEEALRKAGVESQVTGDRLTFLKTKADLANKALTELALSTSGVRGPAAAGVQQSAIDILGDRSSAQSELALEKFNERLRQFQIEVSRAQTAAQLFGQSEQDLAQQTGIHEKAILDLTEQLKSLQASSPAADFDSQQGLIDELISKYSVLRKEVEAYAVAQERSAQSQELKELPNQIDAASAAWTRLRQNFVVYAQESSQALAGIFDTLGGVVNQLTSGIAAAITQLAIYGAGVSEILMNVFAAAAQALIELAVESFIQIIGILISKIIYGNIAAYSEIPFIGLALGIAGAAAAIAAAKSLSNKHKSDVPQFAEGGTVTSPTLALIGERGTEHVIPQRKLDLLIANASGEGEGIMGVAKLYLDGKRIAQTVIERMPRLLKRKGLRPAT